MSPGSFFHPSTKATMPISTTNATTDLDAVNGLLAAIGEAPVASIDEAIGDVAMAVNTLRDTLREVQSMGWRFNTDLGLKLDPTSTTTVDGETLHVFQAPASVLRVEPTRTTAQYDLDLTIRRVGSSDVFWDRVHNRQGLRVPNLFVNLTRALPFAEIPEAARRLVVIVATRRFVAQAVGSPTLVGFTDRDEYMALRNLKRQEGLEDRHNIFNNTSVWSHMGRRTPRPLGFIDARHR